MGGVSLTESDTEYFVIWQCRILHHIITTKRDSWERTFTPASFVWNANVTKNLLLQIKCSVKISAP